MQTCFQVNLADQLLPNVNLVLQWNDTRGDTVLGTKIITDMLCEGVYALFGPEGSCYVEAIVAQSRNIPMFSYVSSNTVFSTTISDEAVLNKCDISVFD